MNFSPTESRKKTSENGLKKEKIKLINKNMSEQLLLFQDAPEYIQERKMISLEEKYEKLRKSQHARISALQKEINHLKSEVELLTAHICKNGLFLS